MSDALNKIVEKAVKDAEFRQLLLADPVAATKGYEVTEEERQMLSGLTAETFSQFAGSLDGRTTKGSWIHGTG